MQAFGISNHRLAVAQVQAHARHWTIIVIELLVAISIDKDAADDDLTT